MRALSGFSRVWLNAALAFFYPEVCQLCREGRASSAEGFVCATCRAQVGFVERPYCECCGRPFEGSMSTPFECGRCRERRPAFSFARSAVTTREPVLEVIHRYKYLRALWFEPFLAGLLVTRAQRELADRNWQGIVPVPLHPTKQREREFNQAERLARHLGMATGLPVRNRLLVRVVPTRTQTHLHRPERMANVRNAFSLRRGARLAGERLVVVDDVFTTGSTTDACARALRAAGAGDVCVWTVARGI